MKPLRVLVTGGGGFIGSHVLKALLRQRIPTISFDMSPIDNAVSSVLTKEELTQVESVAGDICDFPALCRTIKEHQITHIVHLASMLIDAAASDPYRASQVMNGGFVHVLEAARLFGLRKVVWASSMAVFGPDTGDIKGNDDPHNPESVYGACKSWGEHMSEHYYKQWGVDSVGLRFGVVFGFGRLRGPTRFATDLIRLPALNQPFEFKYGSSLIDWQYVGDIAKLTVQSLLAGPLPKRCYNVRGESKTVKEAAEMVRRFVPDADIRLGDGIMAVVPVGDDTELLNDLGVRCETPLERAIAETIASYRSDPKYND